MKYLFFIGIFVVGFLSGMGVLYLVNNEQNSDSQPVEDEKKGSDVSLLMDDLSELSDEEEIKSEQTTQLKNEGDDNQSSNDISDGENVLKSDSANITLNVDDSLYQDSIFKLNEDSLLQSNLDIETKSENFKVKKEKLVKTKKYNIQYLDPVQKNEADSLIENNLGIHSSEPKEMWVEYWQSPLSAKGYVYRNHKVKLYGIDPQLSISLISKEDELYLQTEVELYHLKPTNEFEKFIFVSKDILKD